MRIVSRSRGTKVILEEQDLAKLLDEGKISGGYKGHRYLVTCPPSPTLGVSEEIHNATADQLIESKKEIIELKETVELQEVKQKGILEGAKKLKVTAKKFRELSARKDKELIALHTKVKDTIPIEEHNDLMSAKVKTHDQVVGALEDAQEAVVNKLEDELEKAKNDLADCEN